MAYVRAFRRNLRPMHRWLIIPSARVRYGPKPLLVPRSSGLLKVMKFTDYHGNVWRNDGSSPADMKGGYE